MESLHLFTIYRVGSLINLLFTAYLCAVWILYRKRFAGMELVMFGKLAMLFSQWLLFKEGVLHEVFTIVLSNTILSVAAILVYLGLVRFSGKKIQIQHKVLFVIPFLLLFEQLIFTFVVPHFDVRLIAVTFCLSLPLILCANYTLSDAAFKMLPGRLLGTAFAFMAVLVLSLPFLRFFLYQDGDLVSINLLDENFVLAWLLCGALIVFAFALVVSERLRMEERVIARDRSNLLNELHHRVKNNLMSIEGLLSLQSAKSRTPEVKRALEESRQRVSTISTIHKLLQSEKNVLQVFFPDYLNSVGNAVLESYPHNGIKFDSQVVGEYLDIKRAVACGMIVSEFISNSCKYAFDNVEEPCISLRFGIDGYNFRLDLEDNGVGIDEKFSVQSAGTLGFSLIRSLATQLSGESHIGVGCGASCTVRFPVKTE